MSTTRHGQVLTARAQHAGHSPPEINEPQEQCPVRERTSCIHLQVAHLNSKTRSLAHHGRFHPSPRRLKRIQIASQLNASCIA
jgi:hypothetical protein